MIPCKTAPLTLALKATLLLAAATLASSSARAAIATDNAGNYSSWGSTAGSASQVSAGSGFGNWDFENTAGGNGSENGSFLGNISGGISSSGGKVWGL